MRRKASETLCTPCNGDDASIYVERMRKTARLTVRAHRDLNRHVMNGMGREEVIILASTARRGWVVMHYRLDVCVPVRSLTMEH